MFNSAKAMGDRLIVILNSDEWLVRKKGRCFMTENERKEVLEAISSVDRVYIHHSDADDVTGALDILRPDIFANGGDRKAVEDIPEADLCNKIGIKMVFNIGGDKIQSSSSLLNEYSQ